MKRYTIIVVFAALTATAQPTYSSLDTIMGRANDCWYSMWYDECNLYWSDSNCFMFSRYGSPVISNDTSAIKRVLAKEQQAPGRMAVKGLAAMVAINVEDIVSSNGVVNPYRNDEYLILLQGEYPMDMPEYYFPPYMSGIDMVRWDTAMPQVLKLPQNAYAQDNNEDFLYCYLYKAYFPEPVIVDSTFFIAGTFRSNNLVYFQVAPGIMQSKLEYYPTAYMGITDTIQTSCDQCPAQLWSDRLYGGPHYPFDKDNWQAWHLNNYNKAIFGPFMPIVDYYRLTVQTDNPVAGGVTGSGMFPAMSLDTISAIPNVGYRFSHWSDGHTECVRAISLDSDKTFTAYFSEEEQ